MDLQRRVREFGQYLAPGRGPDIRIVPRPWERRSAPYYVIEYPLLDSDGHGGFTATHRFDDQGVPYCTRADARVYDPLDVVGYAMRMHHLALEREDSQAAVEAHRMLGPLLTSGRPTGVWAAGPGPDQMTGRDPGCATQGLVISMLLRLTDRRPDDGARQVIERAYQRLAAPADAGGTVSSLGGGCFLEQHPSQPSHALSDCLYGLFGLYDLADALGHSGALELARRVEDTIVKHIARFVTRLGWSRCSPTSRAPLAGLHDHRMHARMVRVLAARTGARTLRGAARRWERALQSRTVRIASALAISGELPWGRGPERKAG